MFIAVPTADWSYDWVLIGFRLVPRGFFTRNPALDVADQSR
jgi:Cu2+-containing amine oxidase